MPIHQRCTVGSCSVGGGAPHIYTYAWRSLHTGSPVKHSLRTPADVLLPVPPTNPSSSLPPSRPASCAAVMGLPVSPWLRWDDRQTTMSIDHPMLCYVGDGVLDVSLEIRGPARDSYKPWPAFLHLSRAGIAGSGCGSVAGSGPGQQVPVSGLVPVMMGDSPTHAVQPWAPGVLRLQRSERRQGPGGWRPGAPAGGHRSRCVCVCGKGGGEEPSLLDSWGRDPPPPPARLALHTGPTIPSSPYPHPPRPSAVHPTHPHSTCIQTTPLHAPAPLRPPPLPLLRCPGRLPRQRHPHAVAHAALRLRSLHGAPHPGI